MADPRASVVVLISGAGTTMAALLTAAADPDYPARIAAVGTDSPTAAGLQVAADHGVPTFVVDPADFPDRAQWSRALADRIAQESPDLVLCAGFMRILDAPFVERFRPRLINSHPSLLPAFPGARAVADALAFGSRISGATLHVVDVDVDSGPILEQVAVPVHDGDDESSLHERIKAAERTMLVGMVGPLAAGHLEVDGRKVRLT